jgi:hypothetical protein
MLNGTIQWMISIIIKIMSLTAAEIADLKADMEKDIK